LNISKKIAKKLNGSIHIFSEVGLGSEFIFSFKAYNFQNDDILSEICKEEKIDCSHILNIPKSCILSKEVSLSIDCPILNDTNNNLSLNLLTANHIKICQCPKILIVDDEVSNRNVLTNYCKRLNLLSEQAVNGLQALEYVEKYSTLHDCCHSYKMILMDSNMPIMNGEESSMKIRTLINNLNEQMPIIICVTANAMNYKDNLKDDFRNVYDDIYFKPIRFDAFKEILHKYQFL